MNHTYPRHPINDDELPSGPAAVRWGYITADGTAFEVPGAMMRQRPVRALLDTLEDALYTVQAMWVRDAEDAPRARGFAQAYGIEDVRVMPRPPKVAPVQGPRW